MFRYGTILSAFALAILGVAALAQPVEAQTAKKLKCNGCIKSKQLKNNAVKSTDIKDGEVKTTDLGNDVVTNSKIADGAVTAAKLASGALALGRLPISDCGTIAQSGSYLQINDLPGPAGLNADNGCLVIAADDVVLDLGGFSLVGNGMGSGMLASGIFMDDRKNVVIRNGTIRNFGGNGVREDSDFGLAKNHQVSGLRVLDNGARAIALSGDNHQVTDCFVSGNDGGIVAGNFARLVGNIALDNSALDSGIAAQSASTITGNRSVGNGIGISPGSGSTVSGNTVTDNAIFGIIASSNSTVTGNTASDNAVGIDARINSLVVGNTALNNTTTDIDTTDCVLASDCVVESNRETPP